MTTVYLATCLERRADAVTLAAILRERGYAIASHWHDHDIDRVGESVLSNAEAVSIRRDNLAALRSASVFVCLADSRCRGTLVEIEHAYQHARNDARVLICIGEPRVLGPMSAILWDAVCASAVDLPAALELVGSGS